MLTRTELHERLTADAARIGDDDTRASRAIALGRRRVVHRQRRRVLVAVAAVGVCAAVVPALISRGHQVAPPSAGAIACEPGRTVINTPRVAALTGGAVVTIVNATHASVVVHLGNETAVVAPGVAEGQFPLSPGRQTVQCVSGGAASPAASIAVVAARRA